MKKLGYLGHIDALRALAVILVVLFHLDVELFQGGFIGVDVFFVISGFLITRILNFEYSTNQKISFKRFYTKRARRLMPTLFLTIYATFLLTFLAFSPSDFMNATRSMFMSSVALSNFHFLSESDYFDIASNFKPLLHTWSLGIEEQFYLLYPITLFLLLKLFKGKTSAMKISLALLFLISFIITFLSSKLGVPEQISALFLPKDEISANTSSLRFYLLPYRMFEFLSGAILALIAVPKIKSENFKLGLNLLGLAIIIGASVFFSKHTPYLSSLNLLPCIGAGILIFFPPSKHLSFFFENKFLKYTGNISYTLYLVHWVVIVIYRYLFDGVFSPLEQLALFVIMYLLSMLIFTYYENPLRYTKAKFSIKSNKVLLVLIITNVLVLYALQKKVNNENGWLWRLSDKNLELIDKIGVPKNYHKNNWGGAGYTDGWLGGQKEKNTTPDMIWLGDSHAGHYLYGLDSIMVKQYHKDIYISKWYTSLKLPDIVRASNNEFKEGSIEAFEHDLAFINKYPKSTVVLSHSWISQMEIAEVYDTQSGKYETIPNDSSGWLILAKKIVELQQMSGPERAFIIIGDNPTTGTRQLNYIEKLLRPKYLAKLAPSSSTFTNNRVEFNQFFEHFFKTNEKIVFIDPSKALCENGTCLKQKNDNIYYSDINHFSQIGSLHAVAYMKDTLLKYSGD